MSVTYKFPNLKAIADHFEHIGRRRRNEAVDQSHRRTRLAAAEIRGEAYAYQHIADVLRNTVIEEVKPR